MRLRTRIKLRNQDKLMYSRGYSEVHQFDSETRNWRQSDTKLVFAIEKTVYVLWSSYEEKLKFSPSVCSVSSLFFVACSFFAVRLETRSSSRTVCMKVYPPSLKTKIFQRHEKMKDGMWEKIDT